VIAFVTLRISCAQIIVSGAAESAPREPSMVSMRSATTIDPAPRGTGAGPNVGL